MIEEASTVVAVIAALIACLSAIYARWQAHASQRANDIALHENRLSIYKGVGRFRVHLTAHGANIKEEEVWKFAETVELSEFYFPKEIGLRLERVLQDSLRLLALNEEWRELKHTNPTEASPLVASRHQLSRDTRDECQSITELAKAHLRIGGA